MKPPIITISYEALRFWVCKLCAPDAGTEQAAEHPSGPVSGGSGSDHVCECGKRLGEHGGVYCTPGDFEGPKFRPTGKYRAKGNPLIECSGSQRPYLASTFLDAVASAPGPITGSVFGEQSGPFDGERWQTELTVLSNFIPLGRLFALAALDLNALPDRQDPSLGCTFLDLRDDGGELTAYVCFHHGDGFEIGRNPKGSWQERPGVPPFQMGWDQRGLLVVPGTALIVYGGRAVGIAGWVRGRPLLAMVPEGAGLLRLEGPGGGCALTVAIVARFNACLSG